MPTEPQNEFLRLEVEANRLLEVLSKLKQEIESYKTAHQALEQTAARVGELSDRCGEAAHQLGRLAETLQSVGPRQVLERLDALAKDVTSLQPAVEGLLHPLVRDQPAALAALMEQVERLRALSLWTIAIVLGSLLATLATMFMHG
jgi:DNA repair ATPase RecN